MKLEDQVSSLEPSMRLKELGVKRESHFYHIKECGEWRLWPYSAPGFSLEGIRESPREDWEVFSAFTVAELGEMLPATLWGKPYDIEQYVYENPRLYGIQAKTYTPSAEGTIEQTHFQVSELKEADARAKMLIYLLEKGILK